MIKILLLMLFVYQPLHALAQAVTKPGVVVLPVRVVMEGKKRSESVLISNNGSAEGVYKIEIVNKRMLEDGSIVDAKELKPSEKIASNFIRVSPRRVTLLPNQSQRVRVLARKPSGLADGEYRSHLRVIALPIDQPRSFDKPGDDEFSVSIRSNFAITMPLIVRYGQLDATANITDIGLYKNNKGENHIKFVINREGNKSVYGDVEIYHISAKGKRTKVKRMGGLAVYTPLARRKFDVPLELNTKSGQIEIIYQQKAKDGGKLLASSKAKI